ncbi:MAG TPA: hypothetical protein VL400_16865 [Polyangiaceae bacterium]|nr:hypothetical protein [Polyangiaceae bacterium]
MRSRIGASRWAIACLGLAACGSKDPSGAASAEVAASALPSAASSTSVATLAPSSAAPPNTAFVVPDVPLVPVKTSPDAPALALVSDELGYSGIVMPIQGMWFQPSRIFELRDVTLLAMGTSIATLGADDKWKWSASSGEDDYPGDSIVNKVVGYVNIRGRFPSSMWVEADALATDGARIGGETFVTLHGAPGSWAPAHRPKGVVSWGGTNLLLGDDGVLEADGKASADVPKPTKSGALCGDKPRVNAQDLWASPKLDVFTVGYGCETGGPLVVERWEPGHADGVIDVLPSAQRGGAGTVHASIRATSRTNAVVVASSRDGKDPPYLARFDGKTWTPYAVPERTRIDDFSLSEDGTLWTTGGGAVRRQTADGAWSTLALPSAVGGRGIDFTGIHGKDAKRVWITATLTKADDESTQWNALFSTVEGDPFVVVDPKDAPDSPEKLAERAKELAGAGGKMKPFTGACTTPFVLLFQVADATPADFGYPATRDAMAGFDAREGIVFIEYKEGEHRRLGAKVKDGEQGKKLVDRVTEAVKGSKPVLLCYAPSEVVREVKLF